MPRKGALVGFLYGFLGEACNIANMMNRRGLLRLGLAATAVFTVAGGAVALLPNPYEGGRLSSSSKVLFATVAPVLLQGGKLEGAEGPASIAGLLERLDETVAGLPAHVRRDLGTLLLLLGTSPGRWTLTGDPRAWETLDTEELSNILLGMRRSSSDLRQQAYQALRELVMASYFADASTWTDLGYPGPTPL